MAPGSFHNVLGPWPHTSVHSSLCPRYSVSSCMLPPSDIHQPVRVFQKVFPALSCLQCHPLVSHSTMPRTPLRHRWLQGIGNVLSVSSPLGEQGWCLYFCIVRDWPETRHMVELWNISQMNEWNDWRMTPDILHLWSSCVSSYLALLSLHSKWCPLTKMPARTAYVCTPEVMLKLCPPTWLLVETELLWSN